MVLGSHMAPLVHSGVHGSIEKLNHLAIYAEAGKFQPGRWSAIREGGVGKTSATFSSSCVVLGESYIRYDPLHRCHALLQNHGQVAECQNCISWHVNPLYLSRPPCLLTIIKSMRLWSPCEPIGTADDKNNDGGNRTKWGLRPRTR